MATIEMRGGKFRVKIQRQNHAPMSKTFSYRKDAEAWARQTERAIETGTLSLLAKSEGARITLGQLLERYRDQISPQKRGWKDETARINAILRNAIAKKMLYSVTSSDWAKYKDERLKKIRQQSLHREFNIYKAMYKIAHTEWGFTGLANPLTAIKLQSKSKIRDRRLTNEEWERVITEAKLRGNPMVWQIIVWAKESGMRRGEILGIKWDHINLEQRLLVIPVTKTDESRTIPITKAMLSILEAQKTSALLQNHDNESVFPIKLKNLETTVLNILKKTGLKGEFTFHGWRHERVSSLFELGLSIPEVASISGHKDWRILARYTHPKPQDILRKLEPLS